MNFIWKKHILKFNFPAGTSRGVYHEKPTWIIRVEHQGMEGYGESGPLKGLSIDNFEEIEAKLYEIKVKLKEVELPHEEEAIYTLAHELAGENFPAVRFALETALLDAAHGGQRILFQSRFTQGNESIPINGLIWMGDKGFMLRQANEKPSKGYRCLKMKIGALDFEQELDILQEIRNKYPEITLRLDANGAFTYEEAVSKLNQLKTLKFHSIEQPIKPGQIEQMAKLCANPPIPVALDEELIGSGSIKDKNSLLDRIKPQFIILKPSLLGGFASSNEWINLAEEKKIGWWVTSALESNIGLNAIAQYTAGKDYTGFQGLGTGQLYENNFPSPLTIADGMLFYDKDQDWQINI